MDIETHARTSEDVIRHIAGLTPDGGQPDPAVLKQLQVATQHLIGLFRAEGKLDESPMTLAMNRTVDLHQDAAIARLNGKRVLVTGGVGCVGSRLIPLLIGLGAASVAIVDFAEDAYRPDGGPVDGLQPTTHTVDIRDAAALDAVFAQVKPQVVFHLASVREPGRAEAVVREAIETNVFGTRNIIDACLKHDVEDAIYSSTGKCFAYVTDHVYTGSKKLAEAQWVVAARKSVSTRFRFTRFTHIMENGVVTADIMDGIEKGVVGMHGPDRNFNVQNLRQATHLLINALALAGETPPDGYWSAIDLGWPVNTLELALYNIDRSERPVAIHFLGVPKGYDEAFYRGQFGWAPQDEYHPLINALEGPSGFADSTGTMCGARVQPFDERALSMHLGNLQAALDTASFDVVEVKDALLVAVTGLSQAIFAHADFDRLIDVLWWGAAPAWAGPDASVATRFRAIIGLLSDSVLARLHNGEAIPAGAHGKLAEVVETLALVEGLGPQMRAFQALLAQPAPAFQLAS